MGDQIAELEHLFPAWHVWRGVTGLLYARRPKTSPPKVVRAQTFTALREKIQAAQRRT